MKFQWAGILWLKVWSERVILVVLSEDCGVRSEGMESVRKLSPIKASNLACAQVQGPEGQVTALGLFGISSLQERHPAVSIYMQSNSIEAGLRLQNTVQNVELTDEVWPMTRRWKKGRGESDITCGG